MSGNDRGGGRGGRHHGRGGGDRGQHQGGRMPPPDATGAEANYLLKNKESRTPMVVHLIDGEIVRGIIEYYDREMVKINRDEGPNLFIRKATIRYMHKEGEDPQGSS